MNVLVNGFSMAYSDAGQGPAIVFVHGFPLNRAMWQPQVETLSAHARVLAPDLRGHGDSQVTPGPYSMDLFADDLSAFLDALRVTEPVYLCGLSMGGYISFAFCRRYRERLRGLILTATRASRIRPRRAPAATSRRRTPASKASKLSSPLWPRACSPRKLPINAQSCSKVPAASCAALRSKPCSAIYRL